jgi:hypothetical protein
MPEGEIKRFNDARNISDIAHLDAVLVFISSGGAPGRG